MLVIGAQGALGRLCAEALRDSGFDVTRAGRRVEDAPDFRLIDLDDSGSVAACCADADLVVSTVRHPGYAAERYALREGGTLLSVASFRMAERHEIEALDADPAGQVILDAGLAPGVASLILKELLAEHPDADGLESTGTYSLLEPSGRGVAEDTYPAIRGSRVRRLPTRVLEFPEPFGRARCLQFASAEADAMIFGGLAKGRSLRAYLYLLERPARAVFLALNALGLLSRMPLAFFSSGYQLRRGRTTAKPQFHIAAVLRDGRRLAARAITGSGNYAMTASAIAAYAEVLLGRPARDSALSGVFGVEDAFDLSDLRDGLERRGIRIAPLS